MISGVNKYRGSSQEDPSFKVIGTFWRELFWSYKQELWVHKLKGPARHRERWWWNDDVSNIVREKCKLRKELRQGNTSKDKYLESQKKPGALLKVH